MRRFRCLLLAAATALPQHGRTAIDFTNLPYADPYPLPHTPGACSQPSATIVFAESFNSKPSSGGVLGKYWDGTTGAPLTYAAPAALLAGVQAMSVELWMKVPNASVGTGVVLSAPGLTISASWQWAATLAGVIQFRFAAVSQGFFVQNNYQTVGAVPDGQWHQYVANYAGSRVMVVGPHIVFGYYGEGWGGGQANQFMHYSDDGLFIGQFGQPGIVGITSANVPGFAGNNFSPSLVQYNDEVYLYCNDESDRGAHRWHLTGLDTLAEQSCSLRVSAMAEPTLSIAVDQAQDTVCLAWPGPSYGWVLQESDELTSSNWVTVFTPPTVAGASKTVSVAPLAGRCFYRLSKP